MALDKTGGAPSPSIQHDAGVRGRAEARPSEDVKPIETKGSFKGMEVSVSDDPHALAADAAEELPFSAAETVEKKLFDRKVSPRTSHPTVVSPQESQKAEDAAKKLKGMDAEKLKRLLGSLRQERPSSAADLLQKAREEFSDPTERHAALGFLRDAYAESGEDPELLTFIDTAIIKMEAEEGPAIQAGYNINGVPTTDQGDPGEHRQAYRETILSYKNASQVFTSLLTTYGEQGIGKMLDYISDSLAADLSSLSPSSDPERLNIAGDGIVTARNILTVLDEANQFLDRMGQDFGGKRDVAGSDLVKVLFAVKDGGMTNPVEIKRALPLRGRANPTHDVEFARGMLDLLRMLPDRLFTDGGARRAAVDTMQGVLDECIEFEERILDGLE